MTNNKINLFSVPLTVLSTITVGLPLFAFLFCVGASLIYNFTESTSTHCKVNNFLPSISSSIGNFSPQKYVWRTAIGLHSSPRYLLSYLHFILGHRDKITFTLNLCEISALLGLSFVSSIEDFPLHAKFFTSFEVLALLHMYRLCKRSDQRRQDVRRYCALINLTAGFLSVYLYLRHNWYCEAGVYSLFALSEYLVVFSNMLFHFQVAYEFGQARIGLCDDGAMRLMHKKSSAVNSEESEHLV